MGDGGGGGRNSFLRELTPIEKGGKMEVGELLCMKVYPVISRRFEESAYFLSWKFMEGYFL